MLARILMVVAAAALVAVVAVASIVPPDMPLGQFMLQQDHGSLARLQTVARTLPAFVWSGVIVPVLIRPAWLPPLMLGIVALGGAISLRPRPPGPGRRTTR